MSRNLATKANLNDPVALWSRTLSNAHEHSAQVPNTVVANTAAEGVEKSDMIWSCLSNDDAVQETFASFLKSRDIKGKLFVECSTISPETTRELTKKVIAGGAEFVAMPGTYVKRIPLRVGYAAKGE